MQQAIKIVVERHVDGFVAYPLGMNGVVIGQGHSYQEALTDVQSAMQAHIETFGSEAFLPDDQVLEAYLDEAEIQVG